jgi:biotin carboxyl carrier protein
MPLDEDDVREILRLIDESDVEELRIETAELSLHVVREAGAQPAPESPVPIHEDVTGEAGDGLVDVGAPMLGVFYRAPAPGAPPFVEVGATVEAETVVCLIEVMKMMNPVSAGVVGTVVEACVENAELVEAGAVLFRVRPR